MARADNDFWIRFWGVRGSLPTPGEDTLKYGGNTACVEVRCGKKIVICDMGSGARPMGLAMNEEGPVDAAILISHYHWDHICGIPFCALLYNPENSIEFFGEARGKKGVKAVLSGQMRYPYFPVGLEVFQAKMKFHTISKKETIKRDSVLIKTAPLNHPQDSQAYRIEYRGKSVVYCSDNEHQDKMPKYMAELIRGCDVLIYDAAYTDDEYTGRSGATPKIGWGHSTWDEAVKAARQLKVKKLFIFHHDPLHTDKVIDRLVRECRRDFKELHAAREGVIIKV